MTDKILETPTSTEQSTPEPISFEDFLVRYDGQPVEWHAGKVVETMSNNEIHQLILGFLYRLISLYLELRSSGRAYISGYPMFIRADLPARQPDILVVLAEHYDRISLQYLNGAADIAIEILSPGTASVDRGDKFLEYELAGVREYWMIDPARESVDVYALNEKGVYQRIQPDPTKLTSHLLTGFSLDIALLWGEEMPAGQTLIEMAQTMATA